MRIAFWSSEAVFFVNQLSVCTLFGELGYRMTFRQLAFQLNTLLVIQTSRGKVCVKQSLVEAEILRSLGRIYAPPRRSLFACRASRQRFCLYCFTLSLGKSGRRNTHQKKHSNIPMAILDYLVARQQKSTCVDFSVLARGKIHWCFFLIQIATRKTNI